MMAQIRMMDELRALLESTIEVKRTVQNSGCTSSQAANAQKHLQSSLSAGGS